MSDSSDDEVPLTVKRKLRIPKQRVVASSDSSDDEQIIRKPLRIKAERKPPPTRKRKKSMTDSSDEEFLKPPVKKAKRIKVKQIKKTTVKKKTKTKKKSAGTKTPKRTRKVYDMPGQRKETPSELNGLRIFYESCAEQCVGSKMAENWLLIHGLLPKKEAQRIMKEKENAKLRGRTSSVKRRNRGTSSAKKKASKPHKAKPRVVRKLNIGEDSDSSSDDDAPLRRVITRS